MLKLSCYITYAVVGTVPILFAAVDPWVWSAYTGAVFLAFVLLLWREPPVWQGLKSKVLLLTVGLFFLITLIQILPLPIDILSRVTPFRAKVLEKAWSILEVTPEWASISYLPLESLSRWIFLMGLAAFFPVVVKCTRSTERLNTVVLVLMGIAFLESLYGLFQALVPSLGVLWEESVRVGFGNARGTFINRNHFAGFMEMIWPIALGYTLAPGAGPRAGKAAGLGEGVSLKARLSSDKSEHKILLSLLIVVMVLSIVFSKSRGGITGAFIGFLTFGVLVRSGTGRLPLSFLIAAGAVFGLVFIYGLRIGFGPVIERFMLISSGLSRVDLWQDSLGILYDHPMGVGLFNYKEVFPIYFASSSSELKVASHAHNDYLQFLIEAGWPGFLALAGGFFIFLGRSFKRATGQVLREDPFRFFVGIGALSGLTSLAFHSFFDFNLQIPANCFYFVTLMALVYTCLWKPGVQP